jgi:putative glutamine amidotransferase
MIIGVFAGRSDSRTDIYNAYLDALFRVGASPVLISPAYQDDRLDEVLDVLDALLLAGGGDIEPRRYGQTPSVSLDGVDPLRDEAELRSLARMRRDGKRVLGVCRGAQLLAVAAGGSLVQDLPSAGMDGHRASRADSGYADARHTVKVEPATLTEQILDGLTEINSQHHQSILDPGDGLTVTAWAPDGAVEAIEGAGVLGVQWHPEFLIQDDSRHLRPFRWLVHGQEGLVA